MDGKPQDLRVTKTQRALVLAMQTLLERENFQKITVNDICQEALVSRSTFYSHFEDKYQLLRFTLEQLQHKFSQDMQKDTPRSQLLAVFERIRLNARLFRNLFSEPNQELMRMIQELMGGHFLGWLRQKQQRGETLPGPLEPLSVFYASGVSGMISWWIQKDFAIPAEDLVRCQLALLDGPCASSK